MGIRRFFRRNTEHTEVAREIESHLAHEIDDNIARGMPEEEARRLAYIKFGNPQSAIEDVWEWNTARFIDDLWRDLRYSERTLGRTPGFASIAILIMALGIGANTALFTVVRSVLLKPLPFADPERLVMLYEQSPDGKHPYNVVAGGIFQEWQKQSRSFEQMAIWGGSSYNLSGTNGQLPEKVEGGKCSWNFFSTLGVQPIDGRVFSESEDSPNANGTVILTWSLWQRRFGGDPSLVGKDILLDGQRWTVIGVLPAWFNYPDPETQLWTPIRHETRPAAMDSLTNHQFRVVARLLSGHTLAQGLSEIDTIEKRIRSEHPAFQTIGKGASIRVLLDEVVGDYKTSLYVLLAATACFLLIACLNVANLLVARSAARRRELAIRSALGGSKWRLLREQVSESIVLATIGGVLGMMFAWLSLQWLIRMRHDIPRVEAIQIDAAVFFFVIGISLLSGITAGFIPALGASGRRILEALQESSRSHSGGQSRAQVRKFLLAAEVGLTVVLLIAAGLLLKSYERLRSSDLGCATRDILTMRLDLPKPKYNIEQRTAFFDQVIAAVRRQPGVQKAGMVSVVPGRGYGGDDSFTIAEHPPLPADHFQFGLRRAADPEYFSVMKIPLLRGRTFNEDERLDRGNVVVISDSFAKRYLPNEDPVGKHLLVNLTDHRVPYEIVGVVADTRFKISQAAEPTIYFSLYSGLFGRASIVVRSQQDLNSLALPVQKLIAQMDPDLPVSDVFTMEQIIGNSTINASFTVSLVLGFAILSLLLASVGLYGVLAYLVTQRTGEIGIRIALGAERTEVLRLVLIDGLRPAVIGLLIGLGGGAVAAKLIRNLLYGVQPLDQSVFIVVTVLLSLVAIAGCVVPAWQASRVNPMEALRSE